MAALKRIDLEGYKSIEKMSLKLGPLNVLIGANGAGKSNLVSFFKLLNALIAEELQQFIAIEGGANSQLFYGAKTTTCIEADLRYEAAGPWSEYHVEFAHAAVDTLIFQREWVGFPIKEESGKESLAFGSGVKPRGETQLRAVLGGEYGTAGKPDFGHAASVIVSALENTRIFQFHDTSRSSGMRRAVYVHDNKCLRNDAANLAAVLYKLQQTDEAAYRRIIQTIRQIAPWFGDFVLEPLELDRENVRLNWREKESDLLFGPHQLPDGALRAMALVTLLLQPKEDLPSIIVIDEPELGLHPFAINVLAALVKQAACHCQIILATQSVTLLEQFEPEDVVVVERDRRASTFRRLERKRLEEWLEEYSLGELWQKNVLGGGPA